MHQDRSVSLTHVIQSSVCRLLVCTRSEVQLGEEHFVPVMPGDAFKRKCAVCPWSRYVFRFVGLCCFHGSLLTCIAACFPLMSRGGSALVNRCHAWRGKKHTGMRARLCESRFLFWLGYTFLACVPSALLAATSEFIVQHCAVQETQAGTRATSPQTSSKP